MTRRDAGYAAVLLVLGGTLLLRYATLDLGGDDLMWLRGESPTPFDDYRIVPRLFFRGLLAVLGPSAAAALAMSFLFHAANTLLLGVLAAKVTGARLAGWIAAGVFLVNPLTLFTLTWISCFSYIVGATLALLSTLAFRKRNESPLWLFAAGAAYGVALLCCHELLFLPLVFAALAWKQKDLSRWTTVVFLAASASLAVGVNTAIYDFASRGLQSSRLWSWEFAVAFVSSVFSYNASLALAYPVSFFTRTSEMLRACFEEPGRWLISLAVFAVAWRIRWPARSALAIALTAVALMTPYILRLYLMPDAASYHISYVLSGRVFYLPFLLIAILAGVMGARLEARTLRWLGCAAAIAYASVLLVYNRSDFLGLQVVPGRLVTGEGGTWSPYGGPPTAWPAVALLIVLVMAIRSRRVHLLSDSGSNR